MFGLKIVSSQEYDLLKLQVRSFLKTIERLSTFSQLLEEERKEKKFLRDKLMEVLRISTPENSSAQSNPIPEEEDIKILGPQSSYKVRKKLELEDARRADKAKQEYWEKKAEEAKYASHISETV